MCIGDLRPYDEKKRPTALAIELLLEKKEYKGCKNEYWNLTMDVHYEEYIPIFIYLFLFFSTVLN